MSISSRTFQSAGQISQHLVPGAYSRIDSVKGAGGLAGANNGVVMGRGTGGKPATLLQFNTISEAVQTLKSGPLLEAVRFAFSPGSDLVPQRVFAMRVNTALQSSYNALLTANPMIKFTSRDYGMDMNQITARIEAGTVAGRKVTFGYKTDTEVFDNIFRASLTITHATATGLVNITNAVQTLTLSIGSITIDLNTYPTIGQLAAFINAQSGYSAVVTAGQEDASSLLLDGTTALALVGGRVYESTMQAMIDRINQQSYHVSAEAVNAAVNRGIPANVATVYLTGGSEGTYTGTEWTAALLALEAEDVQFVSTPDDAGSVHAAIKTHCESMSSVTGRKERQFLVGGLWGESVATARAAAIVLNSKWGLRVYNGFTQYDVKGVIREYGSGYAACMLMGMACATAINEPLTFKVVNVISLEKKLSLSNLENLIMDGSCPLAYSSQNLPHIVRQVNTYQTDDLKWNEFSMVKEMGFVSRDLRAFLESRFVGRPATAVGGGVIRASVENRLALYTDLGVFSRDSLGRAWWNVQISISGDTVVVDYDAYITAPVNFIFITNHFHEMTSAA